VVRNKNENQDESQKRPEVGPVNDRKADGNSRLGMDPSCAIDSSVLRSHLRLFSRTLVHLAAREVTDYAESSRKGIWVRTCFEVTRWNGAQCSRI